MGREGEAGRPGPTGRGLCRARRRLWVSNAESGGGRCCPHWSGRVPARCNEDAVGITATSGRLAQTHSAASVPSLPLTVLTGSEGGRWLPGVSGLFHVPAGPRAPSGPAPVPGPCAQRPRPHGGGHATAGARRQLPGRPPRGAGGRTRVLGASVLLSAQPGGQATRAGRGEAGRGPGRGRVGGGSGQVRGCRPQLPTLPGRSLNRAPRRPRARPATPPRVPGSRGRSPSREGPGPQR